jgi:lipoyl(octanoyl) transferase
MPPAWKLLLSPPRRGAENMAIDAALLARAKTSGEAVLRVYAWSRPTLSLGRNQRALGVYDPERARALGVDIVRRMTGGRALLHDHEVTYSITAATTDGSSLRDSYAAINRILLRALHIMAVPATAAAPTRRTPPPASAPCFELPAAGEIVLGDRKLVGSAQVRDEGSLLQHGSILIDDDQPLIAQLVETSVGSVAPAATLREALGRSPDLSEVADALFDAVRELADPAATELADDETFTAAQRSMVPKYESAEWTWRR